MSGSKSTSAAGLGLVVLALCAGVPAHALGAARAVRGQADGPWPRIARGADTVRPGRPPGVREVAVRVGDAEIRALCTDGRVEVVLLHDDGASAESWRPVLERLDGRVGGCAYDRRGSGGSRPGPEQRGWYELVDELRRIHRALGAESPYVLVGHGLGGLYARVYAADRPRDVAGLVLVDPAHEDMPKEMRTGTPAGEWEAWMRRRRLPNADGIVEARLADRARRSRLPPVPVTVLTATRRRNGDGWDARFLNEAARRVHASILRGVSSGRHVPAERSGHVVQRDEPGLVADEIMRIVLSAGSDGR